MCVNYWRWINVGVFIIGVEAALVSLMRVTKVTPVYCHDVLAMLLLAEGVRLTSSGCASGSCISHPAVGELIYAGGVVGVVREKFKVIWPN